MRMEKDDPIAIGKIGSYYRKGENGYPQDYRKALELWYRAGELGYTRAYCSIGYAYENGKGVEVDKEKAKHYYELAATGGYVDARYNLGLYEMKTGDIDRALKHYMIAAGGGDNRSLNMIKELYISGQASKEDYTEALRSYQAYLGEIKSPQRDKAAAAREDYRYY